MLALMPVPGEVDVVIVSELMEAGRAITRGLVTADRTTLIASTNGVYSMTEKIAMGDGRADAAAFLKAGGEAARVFIHRDFAAMAEASRRSVAWLSPRTSRSSEGTMRKNQSSTMTSGTDRNRLT